MKKGQPRREKGWLKGFGGDKQRKEEDKRADKLGSREEKMVLGKKKVLKEQQEEQGSKELY